MLRVEALVAISAELARDLGGVVRAVVRHDEDIHELSRIVLCADAADQVPNVGRLVARSDQNGIFVLPLCRRTAFF